MLADAPFILALLAIVVNGAPEHRRFDRREQPKSLAERENVCGVGPAPHYAAVAKEHNIACGSPTSSCKPADVLDVQDEVLNRLNTGFMSGQMDVHEVGKIVRDIARQIASNLTINSAYANGIVVPLYPVFALADESPTSAPPTQEELTWRALEAGSGHLCPPSKALCECPSIVCQGDRITTVLLTGSRNPDRVANTRSKLKYRSLASLKDLQKLQTLVLSQDAFGPRSWDSLAKAAIPQLRSFVLYLFKLSDDHLANIPLVAPQLQYLQVSVNYDMNNPRDSSALPASALEPICKLRDLKVLEIFGPFVGLPDCIGELTGLLKLDVRGCWFNAPLPKTFANLRQLRSFIAFGQREHHCPEDGCVRSWDNRIGNEDAPIFWCPSGGWAVPLASVAMPEWGSIEKFWVDQNFLSGSIPDWIAERWPHLRSLDLYSNRLGGSIPEDLLELPQLSQLQLHDNLLSGVAPGKETFSASLRFIDVSLNPSLGGCWPPVSSAAENEVVHLAALTEVRRERDCQKHDSAAAATHPSNNQGQSKSMMRRMG